MSPASVTSKPDTSSALLLSPGNHWLGQEIVQVEQERDFPGLHTTLPKCGFLENKEFIFATLSSPSGVLH